MKTIQRALRISPEFDERVKFVCVKTGQTFNRVMEMGFNYYFEKEYGKMIHFVRFGTGAGDYQSILPISQLKKEVDDKLTYTQCSVTILDNDNNLVCYRDWVGCLDGIDEMESPVQFGDFGYYADWVDC